ILAAMARSLVRILSSTTGYRCRLLYLRTESASRRLMPITPASLRAFQVFQKSMRLPSTLSGQRLEAHQFGETVAAVATHRQHEAHQYQQHAGEGEDEVGQLRNRHQQVRQGGGNQGAQGDLEGVATATLFPGDGQAL